LYLKTLKDNYRRFDTLAEAFSEIKPDDIVIYLQMIDKYMIFKTIDDYKQFLENTEDLKSDLYQIILCDNNQKFIFLCNGLTDDDIKKLEIYIKDYFGKNAIMQKDNQNNSHEIMVDILLKNHQENHINYQQLLYFIESKDKTLAEKLKYKSDHFEKITQKKYIEHLQLDAYDNIYDIAKLLGTVHTIENLVINVNGNNNNLAINGGINIIGQDINKITSDWIKNNLPIDGQSKKEYYKSYVNNMNLIKQSHLSPQKFVKFVEESGYKESRNNTVRSWVKK
jgi:hypothetical protein